MENLTEIEKKNYIYDDQSFWIQGAAVSRMFCSGEKEQRKAKQESLEMLRILEEQVISREKIGMVDLAFGQFVEWLGVFEKVIGEKLMESDSFPRLEAWSRGFMAAPAIKESRVGSRSDGRGSGFCNVHRWMPI